MSVWRIKGVASAIRSRAEAAAEKSGTPLGSWLEREIMRRTRSSDKDATAVGAQTAAPVMDDGVDTAGSIDGAAPHPQTKRGRRKKRGKDSPSNKSTADAGATAAPSALSSGPVFVAAAGTSDAPIAPRESDLAAAPEIASSHLANATVIAANETVPAIEDPLTDPVADAVAQQEPAPILTTPRAPLASRSAGRVRLSPVPVLGIGALVALLAIGGYFLLAGNGGDKVSNASGQATAAPPANQAAANPPPAISPPASPAPANPAAAPTPGAAPPNPATPPTGNAAPVPTPSAPPPVATASNLPPPVPGVQPSFLVPVPRADGTSTPPTIAPPAPDFPTRPGPVVAQQDSIASLLTRAEGGDIDAQMELAKRYMQGAPAEQKPSEALRWLEKAAEAGNGQAQFNVAVMYERGIGTSSDVAKAVGWYRKAAAQPIPVVQAMHNLALLYIAGGPGIAADPVQGRVLMARAAELGLPESQYSLALMHFQGVGGPPDRVAALGWLLVAARSNAPPLLNAVSELSGALSPQDRIKAQELAAEHIKRIGENATRRRNVAAEVPNRPTAGDKPLDRAGIAEVQKLLATLKLYGGAADGAMGAKTEQAIREYQAMASLPEDGKATVNLLNSLRDVAGAVTSKPAAKP